MLIYRAYAVGRRGNPLAWPENGVEAAVKLGLPISEQGRTYDPPSMAPTATERFIFLEREEAVRAALRSPCKYTYVVSFDLVVINEETEQTAYKNPQLVWGTNEQ